METLTSARWFPCPGRWPWWCRHDPPMCSSEVREEPGERDSKSRLMPLPGRWPGRRVHTIHTCTLAQAHTQQGCHHLNTNVHSQSTSQPLSHLLHTAPGGTEQVLTSQFFNFIYICPAAPVPAAACGLSLVAVSGKSYSPVVAGGLLIGVACELNSCVVVHRLKLPQGLLNLPRPGIEPGSPALDSGFLTSRPSEKSPVFFCQVKKTRVSIKSGRL